MAEHIARFEVLEKIGEGGMGAVFKARDPAINRVVAIKLLREGFDSGEMRERFMQEARSAGGLQNTNIVTIFELGEYGGAPFIVMEFVVGEPLDRQIRRRAPLPLIRKLELMEALCSGLSYAHRAGIIHRDIKPANLMVNTDGVLKILDFGIARVGDSGLTKTGALIGTPNYMPPEQLHGDPVDRRADIFAVGAVFYELLSYQRAFPGNFTEAITRILHREPDPLSELCQGLDPQIDATVARALDKNPNHRYQDLVEMRRDIARIRQRLARDAPESLGGTLYGATAVFAVPSAGAPTVRQTGDETTSARATAEVEAAERQFEQGETAEAIRRLESFEPANDIVADALASLRDRADELSRESQRRAAVARAVEVSAEAFGRGDYESAIRAADEALLIDERHGPARDLRRRSRGALEEQRRLAELERRVTGAIDEARQLFDTGQRAAAIERLALFQPPQPAVTDMLSELRAESAAISRREEEEARRGQAAAFTERARDLLATGEAGEALAVSHQALALVPDHEGARAVAEAAEQALQAARVQAEHDRSAADVIRASQADFESGLHEQALDRLRHFSPPHPSVVAALATLEENLADLDRRAREAEAQRTRDAEAQRAREESERQAREAEAARQTREAEAARQAQEEAKRQAREAEVTRQSQEEAARLAREKEAARQAQQAEAARKARAVEAARRAETQAEPRAREETNAPAASIGTPVPTAIRTPTIALAVAAIVVAALGFGAFKLLTRSTPADLASAPSVGNVQPQQPPVSPTSPASSAPSVRAPAAATTPAQQVASSTMFPLTIDAEPWANVQITPTRATPGVGEQRGTTPMRVNLPAGEYSIRFTNPAAPKPVVQLVTVAAGKDNSVRLAMPGLDADRILQEILPK